MVFESLVVDLLNRFLGAYVDNLDPKQLKIGIWGGDVVLENLNVKEGALDELDLPVKIKLGHLGKLTLKIPWKNLYGAPVVATLEGLHVLVTPNSDSKYNAEKDEKQKFEAKQRTLQRVEDAKKKEEEQGKEQAPKKDSFAEKLATNVIKNIQVKVSDIHIRYEDKTTNPGFPIAIGATLHNLSLGTTDANWKECVLDESAKLIHKLLRLDDLAVYWNSNTQMYCPPGPIDDKETKVKIQNLLIEGIATGEKRPKDYHYVVEPISSQAQLRINPKPGNDLTTPQAWLNLVVNSIGVALRQQQFRDVMLTLESFERMARNDPFRKYKPDCPAIGNAKKWWHYAYNCVLEETVRRRHKMWSWEHIRKHRRMCKEYTEAYLKKLDTSKPGKDMIENLEKYEKQMSVFSITMCRQQAEMDFIRLGLKRKKQKAEQGWFGGWFGGGKKAEEKKPGQLDELADQFASAMTQEEKSKLYSAIGYSEKAADPTFPKEYVGIDAHVCLRQTYVKLIDDSRAKPEILNLSLTDLIAGFKQRPAAEAIKLELKIDDFSVFGTAAGDKLPQMVESIKTEGQLESLLTLLFETNPLDGKADQRIRLNTNPLKIVYDAVTVNQIAKFFEPPDNVHLDDLSAAAASSLVDITEQSSTGLQYMVDNKSVLDLKIDVKASYVIVPECGVNDGSGSVLVLDLGNFKMNTVTEERPTGRRLENEALDVLMDKAYDKFNLNLQSCQVILATKDDDWQAARILDSSPLHLLQPLQLTIGLHKCMVEDPRLAKIKVLGELPDVCLDISDYKINELVKLFTSIPFPEGKKQQEPQTTFGKDTQFLDNIPESALVRMAASEAESLSEDVAPEKQLTDQPSKTGLDSDDEFHSADEGEAASSGKKKAALARQESKAESQRTDVELQFELKQIGLNVFQRVDGEDKALMSLRLQGLGAQIKKRPWDMMIEASLGSVSIEHKQYKALDGKDLFLVRTPTYDEKAGRLLTFKILMAEPKNPEFHTTYGSTQQDININFTTLEVVAHAEAILNLTEFADNMVAAIGGDKAGEAEDEGFEDEGYLSEDDKKPVRRRKKKIQPRDTIDVKLTANLDVIALAICTQTASLTEIQVKGLEAGVIVQKHKTTVDARLQEITIVDPTPQALHPKILSTLDKEVFKMRLEMFNGATAEDGYSDMNAVDMRVGLGIGGIRAVFLNKFVMDLLAFVDLFSRAKAKVAEASADAAASMQKTVGDMSERADRIALDVSIKAPIIVVPKSSTSDKALVADLGLLRVQNSFSIAEGTAGQETPAILDTMKITLEKLQLCRAIIENEKTKCEVNILQPMSLRIGVCRNLAAAWYHKVPAVDVSGKLEAIKLFIGPDDFGVMMGVLSENLPEGEEERKAAAVAQAAQDAAIAAPTQPQKTQTKTDKQQETPAAEAASTPGGEVWLNMKLNFAFDGITASLYGAKLDLRPLSGKVERPLSDPLGEFMISELKAGVEMNSDNSMKATAILGTVQLDDIRPTNRPGQMTRMLGLRPVEGQQEDDDRKMVSVSFEQKANMDKNVDAVINNIQALICVEFLMTIADIFTKGMAESAEKKAEKEEALVAAQSRAATPAASQQSQQAAPPQGTMTISATLEQPEIVLIADVSKDDTNALFLKLAGKVDMIIAEDTMSIKGGLNGLRIDACPYNPSKRKGKYLKVLLPCNIDFILNAPKGQGQHISVTIPEIMLNISPETIKILSAASQSLTPPQAESKGTKAVVPADTWDAKKLSDCKLWFLQQEAETDVDALLEEVVGGTDVEAPRGEELIASIGSIVIKLEAVIGQRTVPTLALEASMEAHVKDWSSQLNVKSNLKVEVSCYNDKAGSWEPLLEPVECESGYKPYDLCVEVVKNDLMALENSTTVSNKDEEEEGVNLAPPVMTITVSSDDNLELTITKTCLVMLGKLGEVFGAAMANPDTKLQDSEEIPACKITNKLGLPLVIIPGSYYESSRENGGKISMKYDDVVKLDVSQSVKSTIKMKSFLKGAAGEGGKDISLKIDGYEEIKKIPIVRAGNVMYNLTPTKKTASEIVFSVVLEISANMDTRNIVIRSPLQFHNHFDTSMEVYMRVSNLTEKVGTVGPHTTYQVPLKTAYTAELLVKPSLKSVMSPDKSQSTKGTEEEESHQLCDQTILWSKLWELRKQKKRNVTFQCPAKTAGYTPYFFNIVTEMDELRYVKGSSINAPKYTFHIHPVVVLRNLLPIPVKYTLQGTGEEITVESTAETLMSNVEMGKTMMFMTVPNYLDEEWKGEMTLRNTLKEFFQWGFRGGTADNAKMFEVGVWANYRSGFLEMALFAPYWLINKTGLPLSYKSGEDVIAHAAETEEPTLFSYPSKLFSPGKNKIQLQVCESEWSEKFSLDTVGSYGFIACKTKDQNLEVGVHIQLSNFGMTKMVIFTPRYVCVNQTDYDISCSEPMGRWYDIPKGECIPFWPVDKKQDQMMVVMEKDSGSATSKGFLFTDPHTTVLKLESEMGGAIVEVHVAETGNIIVFKSFQKDNFTIQLVNDLTDQAVHFHQVGITDQHLLGPKHAMLYTWQDPTKERTLTFNIEGKDYKNALIKDGIGEVKLKNNDIIYWVSFLDGTQRKLLFTQDLATATKAQQASELEQPDQEIILSLPGLGLSLVNNINRSEVAYIGIRSSGIIWQNKVRKRWKDLSGREVHSLEEAWQKAQKESQINKDAPPKIHKVDNMEVDFANMSMLKPKHRGLRRTYHPGIWAQMRKSPHQLQFHTKVNRLQIDNQMPAPVFPTILAPVPLPKSVAAESAAKPVIEFCLMMSFSDYSSVIKVKYMRLLVQEMHAKVDIGFLNNLMQVFASDQSLEGKEREYMDLDLAVVTIPLKEAESIKAALAREAVNYYDEFHLSPLKIHVSFSLSDIGDESEADGAETQVAKKASAGQNTLRFFLQSVGVTLTNVDDVLFKLGYFERKAQFYNQPQLVMEIAKHYTNQGIKQLYVLVLGLDVIGNPFGFVRGVSTGVKDFFYEPYQGIVQGPEEFAEGIALGMRSLFGHAVGGAAGAVSRITGTLGKGLAALTMDEEYKRKRQQAINQRPATFQEGLARGGKGLVMGFVEGASGIVTNPFQGAKKEGAKGFFKGVGRGLIGVVAKPTAGVVDFASGTLEGIRRVTDVGDEVGKLRNPRVLYPDGIVRPYKRDDAAGLALLHQVEKGKYAANEDYVAHVVLTTDKKHALVVTTKRLMLATKGDLMGSWTVEFQYPFVDLKEPPKLTDRGIQIMLKEKEAGKRGGSMKKGLGLFKGKPAAGKMIQVPDRGQAEDFLAKVHHAMAELDN
ncbi:intermembrane lipid transfer protein VPS13A-like [Amphiura filiformis]|uniref:intermembrane lipid transfer protein VPS13A-like n=1 Tax=Amphiura filiformis TaxID=82378 RepID=UPI003B225D79